MKITLQSQLKDQPIEVELVKMTGNNPRAHLARCNDRQIQVEFESLGADAGLIRCRGRSWPFHVWRSPKQIQIWIAGRIYSFSLIDHAPRRATAGAQIVTSNHISAPMPGTILKILIKAGQEFKAHQPLIIMESMKMEMTLSSPHPGRIKEIKCREGQLVEIAAVLAMVDKSGE